ncbi:MAG: hypothetical protein APF80_01260 [Alphaproteobacteria bacterium BRH_c36]|nr:MAG: hypothetical protein APF80_01260 [Alphaproteobacteria bacterium BRH_c36]
MIGQVRRAGLVLPGVMSLLGLGILIGLGSWQIVRKAEKEELIAKIEAKRTGEPLDLESVLRRGPASEADYQRVRVSGTFVPGKERFYYAPQPRLGPGYDIYQPLKYTANKVVWVNRGYIPERERGNPQSWRVPEGEVSVIGTARLPAMPGNFTPENDIKGNVWYWRDLTGMHNSAFAGAEGIGTAPLFVVAEPEKALSEVDKAQATGGPWPKRGVSDLVIVNRHLEYALTWFGLAATLVGVFAAFALTRLRKFR